MNYRLPLAILLLLGFAQFSNAADDWAKQRFGRPHPAKFKFSLDPEVVKDFMPSGVGVSIVRCGDFTVLKNHGLYFSNEGNPDTSRDMLASIIVFKGNERVFVARGYKFTEIRHDAAKKTIQFDHWTGVQGDKEIEEVILDVGGERLGCKTLSRSTKGGILRRFAALSEANKALDRNRQLAQSSTLR